MYRSFNIWLGRRHRATAAFTLVELLVVMGVISLLLVAVLPAFKGLGLSVGARGAVGTTLAVLDRARMMAISDGQATYVVFASPTSNGPKFRPDLVGTSYAIYEDHDNVSFAPEQRTSWLRLPLNIACKVTDDGNHSSITTRVPKVGDQAFPVTAAALAGGAATTAQLPYWKFDGTGTVDEQNANYLRLLMFPGVITPTGQEIPTQNAGGAGNTTKNVFYEIDVNPATGRAKYILNPQDNLVTPSPTP